MDSSITIEEFFRPRVLMLENSKTVWNKHFSRIEKNSSIDCFISSGAHDYITFSPTPFSLLARIVG
jgi:hypothetical protein